MPVPAVESSMPRIKPAAEELKKLDEVKPKPMSFKDLPQRAKVVVHLPADAKLYSNGDLTELKSSERSFSTPDVLPVR